MSAIVRRLKYTLGADMIDLLLRRTSLLDGGDEPPARINFAGGGDFRTLGEGLVAQLREQCGLADGERVLDIGCGIGRAAVALQRLVPDVRYAGFDIVRYGITWCTKRFADRPEFRFTHADIRNGFYNPRGRLSAADYRFPYPDGSFDVAFATSVFTHMHGPDVAHYLRETGRCLAPGGRAYLTCFQVDGDAHRAIADGRAAFTFVGRRGETLVESDDEPEMAIAFGPETLDRYLAASSLTVVDFHPGSWRGIAAGQFQDAYVVRAAA